MADDKNLKNEDVEIDDEIHSPDYKEPVERVGFNKKNIMLVIIALIIAGIVVVKVTTLSKKEQTPEEAEKAQNQNFQPAQNTNIGGIEKLQSNYANKPDQPVELQQQPPITTNKQIIDAKNNPNRQQQQQDPYQNANYLPNPDPNYQQQPGNNGYPQRQVSPETEMRLKNECEAKKRYEEELNKVRRGSLKFNSDQTTGNKTSNNADRSFDALMSAVKNTNSSGQSEYKMPDFKMPEIGQIVDVNKQKDKQSYLDKDRANIKTGVRNTLQFPTSPFQIMAGTIIPSTFLTGIKGDLPGQIVGQVRENVYDSVRGKYLLIPQGTRVIGEYSSAITAGQDRVLIVWTRLILPNGGSINLEGMPGVDLSGYAGVSDKVNFHFMKVAGGAILSSLLGAGVSVASGNSTAGTASVGQQAANGAASKMNETGSKIVDRFLDQQPTIEIRPGTKFNVFVNKDIILQPYRN